MKEKNILNIEALGFPWKTQDPFLFCAHHRDEYPKGNDQMGIDQKDLQGRQIGSDFQLKDGWRMYHGKAAPGFPYHPHRGFETITINKEGFVDHSDSLGAAGRFGAGDVQWMTAGKGVLHSEMFPLVNSDQGNPLEIFQVWLNLPRASKFVDPHFKMLWNDMIPTVVTEDENGITTTIDVIAGSLNSVNAPAPTPNSWASHSENDVAILTIKLEPGAIYTLPKTPNDVSRTLYFYKGSTLKIESKVIPEYHMIEVNPAKELTITNADKEAYVLMLQGKAINEPVAQHGPFVMNTQDEIREAFQDYQRTQFGGWPWPMQEQMHDRDKGRFALHADGTEERRLS